MYDRELEKTLVLDFDEHDKIFAYKQNVSLISNSIRILYQ